MPSPPLWSRRRRLIFLRLPGTYHLIIRGIFYLYLCFIYDTGTIPVRYKYPKKSPSGQPTFSFSLASGENKEREENDRRGDEPSTLILDSRPYLLLLQWHLPLSGIWQKRERGGGGGTRMHASTHACIHHANPLPGTCTVRIHDHASIMG